MPSHKRVRHRQRSRVAREKQEERRQWRASAVATGVLGVGLDLWSAGHSWSVYRHTKRLHADETILVAGLLLTVLAMWLGWQSISRFREL
jgi:hypothetical protein